MFVLIGDATLHIAKHAKRVINDIFSVCVCVFFLCVNSVTVSFMGQ